MNELEKYTKELPKDIVSFIEDCMKKPHPDSYLIEVLHKVQDCFGFLSKEKLEAVSQLMQIPSSKVSGVSSFYHLFRLKPKGKVVISVCKGTACFVIGADKVAQRFKEELGIDFGETTSDGNFTLEDSRCLGTCSLAPVVKIGDKILAKVTPDQVASIIENCMKNI